MSVLIGRIAGQMAAFETIDGALHELPRCEAAIDFVESAEEILTGVRPIFL